MGQIIYQISENLSKVTFKLLVVTTSVFTGSILFFAFTQHVSAAGGFTFNMSPSVEVYQNSATNFLVSTSCSSPFVGPITGLAQQTTTSGVTYSFADLNGSTITQIACGGVFRVVVTAGSSANPLSVSSGTLIPVTVALTGTASGIGTLTGGTFNLTIWGQPKITSFVITPAGGAAPTTPNAAWQTSYTSACAASSNPQDPNWNSTKGLSGSQNLGTLNSNGSYSYTLTCSGSPGTVDITTSTPVVISSTKIHVDFTINNTISGFYKYPYDGSGQMYGNDANYSIIDRTTGVVILPQGNHPQKLDVTQGVVPGHTYQLVYKGGNIGTIGGVGKLYTHASPFITGGVDNNCANNNNWSSCYSSVSTITPSSGQTVDFFINLLDNGTMSDGGSACLSYTVNSNPYSTAELDFRLNSNENGPHSVSGTWTVPVTSGFQGTDFTSDNSSLYSTSPTNITANGSFDTTLTWNSSNSQALREAPGDYIFYPYSSNGMNQYCSTIRYKLTIDQASSPDYRFITSADTLYFTAVQNGSVPSSQKDTVTSLGNRPQNYTVNGGDSWLTVNPRWFYMTAGDFRDVSFVPNTTALAVGTYSTVVRVVNDNGDYKDILVVYNINSGSLTCPTSGNDIVLSSNSPTVGSVITATPKNQTSFKPHVDYGLVTNVSSQKFVDIDRDGVKDVITVEDAHTGLWTVQVQKTNSNGTLTNYFTAPASDDYTMNYTNGPRDIEALDLNGDGYKDIVVSFLDEYAGTYMIFMNNKAGGFDAPFDSFVYASSYIMTSLGDLYGDGKEVFVGAVNYYGGMATIYEYDSGSHSLYERNTFYADNNLWAIKAGDVNGDGKLDLLISGSNSGRTQVYLFGNINNPYQQPTNNYSITGMASNIGDFNADGKMDIVTINGGNNAYIYYGDGTGNFSAGVAIPIGGNANINGTNYQVGFAAGDFNGDGFDDFAVVIGPGGGVEVLTNNTDGTFSMQNFSIPLVGEMVYTTDLNKDGILDLIVTTYRSTSVLIGDGGRYVGGTFTSSDPATARVNGNKITILGTGHVTISGTGWTYIDALGNRVSQCQLNPAEISVAGSADVKVSKDSVSWTDGPLTIGYGASAYVNYSASNNSDCSLTGNGNTWNHAPSGNGTYNSPNYLGGAQTSDQVFQLSCDGQPNTDSATVKVKAAPVLQSVTNSDVSCGDVKITWVASGANDTYNIYRNTLPDPNNGGSLLILSGYAGNSYVYTVPQGVQYYYFVKAVDQAGNISNYSNGLQASSLSCTTDLSTSDIELTAINGITNTPIPNDCNRNTQSFSPAPGLLRRGNKITFKVNICNSGGVDFVASSSTPIKLTSTMANLTFSPTDAITYNCGGCTGDYQLSAGGGSNADVVVFNITNGTLPKQSGGSPSVWSITFSATTRIPTSSAATIFRFNHRADLQAGSITNSYSTPYYFFYFNQANPIIKEVGH